MTYVRDFGFGHERKERANTSGGVPGGALDEPGTDGGADAVVLRGSEGIAVGIQQTGAEDQVLGDRFGGRKEIIEGSYYPIRMLHLGYVGVLTALEGRPGDPDLEARRDFQPGIRSGEGNIHLDDLFRIHGLDRPLKEGERRRQCSSGIETE